MRLNQKFLTISLAFSLGILSACNGSPGDSTNHAELNELKAKSDEQQKAIQELSGQVRTLNEEGNRLKSLVSQLTDGVLAQKQTLQNLKQAPAPVPPAPKPTYKKSFSKPAKRSTFRKPTPKPTPKPTLRKRR